MVPVGICTMQTGLLEKRDKKGVKQLRGLKHSLSRVSCPPVLEDTCFRKAPGLSGAFHLLFFLRSRRCDADGPGAAICPPPPARPGCGSAWPLDFSVFITPSLFRYGCFALRQPPLRFNAGPRALPMPAAALVLYRCSFWRPPQTQV
jgi:hypothetical protein